VSGAGFSGKPRPAVIIQSDDFSQTGSVALCLLTTSEVDAAFFRIPVEPSLENGLAQASSWMVDKLTAVRRDQLGRRIGRLGSAEMLSLEKAALVFLGFTH
jgi:mRNA interferase MazF